jgi:hypothetical protein
LNPGGGFHVPFVLFGGAVTGWQLKRLHGIRRVTVVHSLALPFTTERTIVYVPYCTGVVPRTTGTQADVHRAFVSFVQLVYSQQPPPARIHSVGLSEHDVSLSIIALRSE